MLQTTAKTTKGLVTADIVNLLVTRKSFLLLNMNNFVCLPYATEVLREALYAPHQCLFSRLTISASVPIFQPFFVPVSLL